MNANELIEFQEDNASEARANGFSDVRFMQTANMLRILEGQLAFRIDAVTKYQAWIKELEISKQSWEIIAKGYGKTIDEQQAEIDALKKEAALQRLSDFTQEAECKHGVDDGACKECYQDATEPVALTQVEIMNALTLGIPLYTHPVKELHLSLQKSKQTGELLAVTYTDDEHRIVEVLWSNESHKIATIAVKSNELGV